MVAKKFLPFEVNKFILKPTVSYNLRKIIELFIQGCLFSNKGAVINKGPVINIYNLRKTETLKLSYLQSKS